ncbi:MAG: hypothetical protein KY476_09170 [Planctomycetes bacterium]|nr:hypothetical protein [Planctomycetota bacterium]
MRPRLAVVVTAILVASRGLSASCPFCGPVGPTLSEQAAEADVVALGQWSEAQPRSENQPGWTRFQIVQVAKSPPEVVQAGESATVPTYLEGRPGNLFLLMAAARPDIAWDDPRPVSETGYQYVVQAPSIETPRTKRLEFFLKFLEYPDPLVAEDAYAEFAKAPYADVAALRDRFSREKLREWLNDADLPSARRGLYGLLLGLCGLADDSALLAEAIFAADDGYRPGLDGLIGGYLLLTGEEGLRRLEREKIANLKSPAGDLFAVMSALRFFWSDASDRIHPERLRAAMRRMLERPAATELAVADLARWKDWSVMDRVVGLYDSAAFVDSAHQRSTRRSVIRYLLSAIEDADVASDASPSPAHVGAARRHLANLRERDPKLVAQVERFHQSPAP